MSNYYINSNRGIYGNQNNNNYGPGQNFYSNNNNYNRQQGNYQNNYNKGNYFKIKITIINNKIIIIKIKIIMPPNLLFQHIWGVY
jgi:hypothetical protein